MSEEKRKPSFKLTIKPVKDSPLNEFWPSRYQGKPAAMSIGAAWADKYGGYTMTNDKEVWIGKDLPRLPAPLYVKLGDQFFPIDNFFLGLRPQERKTQVVAPVNNPFANMIVGGSAGPVANPFAAALTTPAVEASVFIPPGADDAKEGK